MTGSVVDALLFDVGNVVVEVDFSRVLSYWSEVSGTDPSALQERFGFDAAYERHERGEITGQAYFASLRRTLGIDISDEHFLVGWNAVFVDEVPGIRDVLTRVHATRPTYAFTNTNTTHYRELRSRFDYLFASFGAVFASSEIGLRKPEPAAFEHVARAVGAPLERILFFDDSEENVAGAREMGMQTVLVRSIRDVHSAIDGLD